VGRKPRNLGRGFRALRCSTGGGWWVASPPLLLAAGLDTAWSGALSYKIPPQIPEASPPQPWIPHLFFFQGTPELAGCPDFARDPTERKKSTTSPDASAALHNTHVFCLASTPCTTRLMVVSSMQHHTHHQQQGPVPPHLQHSRPPSIVHQHHSQAPPQQHHQQQQQPHSSGYSSGHSVYPQQPQGTSAQDHSLPYYTQQTHPSPYSTPGATSGYTSAGKQSFFLFFVFSSSSRPRAMPKKKKKQNTRERMN